MKESKNLEEEKQIETIEQAEKEVERRHLDPDVFNALNLYDEKLGEEYEKQGYNPFEPNFKLTEDFALEVLEAKAKEQGLPEKDFLETNIKKVTSYFKNTLQTGEKLAKMIEDKMATPDIDMSTMHQLQRAIIFLKNRNQLLKRNIRELKFKNANAIQMFADMYALDKELSDLLKDSYKNEVDVNAILKQFVEVCQNRAKQKIYKEKQQNKEKQKQKELREMLDENIAQSGHQIMHDMNEILETAANVIETLTQQPEIHQEREPRPEPLHHHDHNHSHDHSHSHDHNFSHDNSLQQDGQQDNLDIDGPEIDL